MRSSDLIKNLMRKHSLTYADIARRAGYKSASNVTAILCKNDKHEIRLDIFVKLCDACGYRVVVKRGDREYEL